VASQAEHVATAALGGAARDALAIVDAGLARTQIGLDPIEVGTLTGVTPAIARVRGLRDVRADELVRMPGDLLGIASSLTRDEFGVVLLGRVVNPLGRPLDDGGPIHTRERRPIERTAPPIFDRAPVTVPLQTGLKVVDALVPIGRGQRELILGDRQSGKTAVAVEAMTNQKAGDVISIYCAVGQRSAAVARVIADLDRHGVLTNSIVVVAGGEDPPGMQFIAPYAATTMAEFFVERGRDVLIVYDDLTRHARAYRELSLLLRRPPGREAYPGDVFYLHARLLERAAHLRPEAGGGTLTALPIIETQAQNLSAYIPTNLISITDGQIYLSPELFRKGILPAVDVGRSVSRVGGRAQLPAYRAVAPPLRLAYAQFEELEAFARFGTRLDPDTRRRLERGRRVREILKQTQHRPLAVPEQIATLLAASEGLLDALPIEAVGKAEEVICRVLHTELADLCTAIVAGADLPQPDRTRMLHVVARALEAGGLGG
jgi:F-type H+-transporting ATPase subunit alpha